MNRGRRIGPTLSVSPRSPAFVDGQGAVTINWDTGDDSPGLVRVAVEDGPEALFATGSEGSQLADWITEDVMYTFRLYRASEPEARLAKLQFPVTNPAVDLAIDIAILGLLASPALLAGFAYRQLARSRRRSSRRVAG